MSNRLSIVAIVLIFAAASHLRAADNAGPVPALPWLHEGTVLNFSRHAAIVPGKPITWKQDYYGDWIDPRTGQSYDKFVNYGTSAPMIGQTLVLAIDGNTVAMEGFAFGLEQNLGFADPVLVGPGIPYVDDVLSNSYWKSPAVLANEVTDANAGKLVTRVQWPLGDKKVDAIRIQVTTEELYQMEIYDLKSGLCLHVASAWIEGPNADTHISRSDLIRIRRLDIPWANEPIPPGVLDLSSMHYTGTIKKGGAFAGLRPQQVVMDFTSKDKGQRWIRFNTSATVDGLMAATPPIIFGPGEFGGLWIGSKAAAALQQGQVLDDDPDTKMKVEVAKITPKGVEINWSNAVCGRGCVYDLSTGIQTGWAEYDGPTKTSQMMQRQSSGKWE